MIARGLRSCCTTKADHKSAHSHPATRRSHASSTRSVKSRISLDSCCVKSCCDNSSVKSRSSLDSCCGKSCCDNVSVKSVPRDSCKATGCANVGSRVFVDSCCGDGCCASSLAQSVRNQSAPDIGNDKEAIIEADNLEEGVGTPNQHAVLAVRGMTCTGCERKLVLTLKAIPFITNIKTSLVLCRAEFDFDSDAADLQAIIETVEKRSGFSAELMTGSSQCELRLLIDGSLHEKVILTARPDGIKNVIQTDRAMITIVHDPRIIGARAILEFYAPFSPTLAPEPRDPALMAGAKHIKTLTIRTALSWALTIPVLVMAWAPLPSHPHAYAIASLALATIVQTAIARAFYVSAFKSLFFSRLMETDLLIVLSTSAAYIYSVIAFGFLMSGHPLASGEFFETSTLLVTLITLGQLVTAFARQRAMEAISIRSLQQSTAILVFPNGDAKDQQEIDIRLLQYGDHFKVGPDMSIITDGVVQSGRSEVDESMMTGESLPVEKTTGSVVIAGTINGSSTLIVEATRLPGDNTISDIAGMVDDARFSRAKVQDAIDRIAKWFIPLVLFATIITFLVWLAVGITVRNNSGGDAAVTALTYAIAVLAISCPCAIVLAVPMVILVAGGVAAKLGLVFKAATTIETARIINHVVFDKTGTLTQGHLSVVYSQFFNIRSLDVHSAVAALVSSSKHPIALSINNFLGDLKSTLILENAELVMGKGIQATASGRMLRGGSAQWLGLQEHVAVKPLLDRGLSVFCVQYDQDVIAIFGLEDDLRPETRFVVDTLRKRGVNVSILSGDHVAAVNKVATCLDIPVEQAKAACLPADKQEYIKTLVKQGDKVLFCGDGTNDAVALAQAHIGVHMHNGEGAGFAASAAADVVLIHPSLTGILTLFQLSEAVSRRITLNFVWCFVYNSVAILFAAGAFVNARITPAYAGLGEIVSVLPVVMVAWQLKWFKMSG